MFSMSIISLCVCVFLCISILFVNVRAQSQRCPLPCPFKKFCFILSFLFFSRLSTSFCSYLSSSSLSLSLSFVLCFFWTQCDWFTFYESTHFAFSFCLSLSSFFACTFDLPLCIRFYYLFIFLSFLLCFFFLTTSLVFFLPLSTLFAFSRILLIFKQSCQLSLWFCRPSEPIDMQFVAQL